jgi:hypothetical protein
VCLFQFGFSNQKMEIYVLLEPSGKKLLLINLLTFKVTMILVLLLMACLGHLDSEVIQILKLLDTGLMEVNLQKLLC